jgi:hypothetical protein
MPSPLATLYRYFAAAPQLAQVPHLTVAFGRRSLDDSSSAPRIVMAWPDGAERYEAASNNNPSATDTAARLLWLRVCPVELHLWAAALTGEGKVNGAADEVDHVTALEELQQVACQALASEGVWTRYRATPRSLRWNKNSGQNNALGMQAVMSVDVWLPVQDRPDLLVTVGTVTSTGSYAADDA